MSRTHGTTGRHRSDVGFDVTRAREALRVRVDAAADPLCSCGWITARDTCPMCGGTRPLPDAH